MHRLRKILLSGLVALLMVGMVTAADNQQAPAPNTEVDTLIGFYMGSWAGTICIDDFDSGCIKVWISFDVDWLKNFLF
ncbi:MAG: hypothetical protein K9M55_04380 [Candidatus Marinimicrobia bacterium]|nr:hypothetical protein [Candidatus Neomarinimicrobiota bacterium]MCF7921919.1 hypothetical protein [Candidatus Neomarinimicrobiota bacterium]